MFHVPEKARITTGMFGTTAEYGNKGLFRFAHGPVVFRTIAADGEGWEHVSVSLSDRENNDLNRCPTWEEMCMVKAIFWDETDCVLQYHPPASEYINTHNFVLHLWRPIGVEIPLPPKGLV